jgi:hypothetical protein
LSRCYRKEVVACRVRRVLSDRHFLESFSVPVGAGKGSRNTS